MAKRRFEMTEKKITRFVREGRGTGDGIDYKGWLTVHDLSSLGRSTRMLGRHNRRVHHLFSDIERGAFLEHDWRDDVIDIKEQFPLDRGATRVIAASMGVRHPRVPGGGIEVVMSTDLLVSFKDGTHLALACKSKDDLAKPRTCEKLEIERRYWNLLGTRWGIWTESSTTRIRTENLAYLHEYVDADEQHWLAPGYWVGRAAAFLALLARSDPDRPFAVFAAAFDGIEGFGPGDAVATMRYLACRKAIVFDLDVAFDHTAPLGRSVRPVRSGMVAKAA